VIGGTHLALNPDVADTQVTLARIELEAVAAGTRAGQPIDAPLERCCTAAGQALELSPDHAVAHLAMARAGLAAARRNLSAGEPSARAVQELEQALAAADRAGECNPSLAEAEATRAVLLSMLGRPRPEVEAAARSSGLALHSIPCPARRPVLGPHAAPGAIKLP
jgi:hypothetical protein